MIRLPRYVPLLLAVQLAAGCGDTDRQPAIDQPSTNAPAGSTGAAEAPRADEHLVLALGDSLYAGYGLDQSESFPARLEAELEGLGIPAKVVNAGISGETSAGGLRRLGWTLDSLERKPDLLLLGLGANDMLRGLDPAETRGNLGKMLEELDRRRIPVLLTGMKAPRNLDPSYRQAFESIYPDLARKHGAELDPFFLDGVIASPGLLLPDGLHPNAQGTATIARRLAPQVAGQLRTAQSERAIATESPAP